MKLFPHTCIIVFICLSGCSRTTNIVDSFSFDTAFSVCPSFLSDSGVLARSVISKGDTGRLKYFLAKAKSGNSLKIGCIGGSITAGAMASAEDNRYINRLASSLQGLFPMSSFSIINAGIGATTSRFGCSRARDDLLVGNPDLIIIEYAVNDFWWDSVLNVQTIEGLVRQCMRLDSVPTLMLFTTDSTGDTSRAHLQAMVGTHYNLPIISYRNAMWPLITTGRLHWESIAVDDVHPNDNGHLIIANLLYSYIKTISSREDASTFVFSSMPSPLTTDLYEFAGIHSSNTDDPLSVKTNSGWAQILKENGRVGYSSSNRGDSIVFSGNVNEVTIGYRYAGNLSGKMQIKLDGRIIDTIDNHFSEDWGSGYMSLYQLYAQKAAPELRTFTVTNIEGSLFDVSYILFARYPDHGPAAAGANITD